MNIDIQEITRNTTERLKSLFDEETDYFQWGFIVGAFLLALPLAAILRRRVFHSEGKVQAVIRKFFRSERLISAFPFTLAILLWLIYAIRSAAVSPCSFIHNAAVFMSAFTAMNIATVLSRGGVAPKFIGSIIFTIFALKLFGIFESVKAFLTDFSFNLGELEINVWAIIVAVSILLILLWLASLTTKFIDLKVEKQKNIPPSIKVLVSKVSRFLLFIIAFLASMQVAGISLSALTVFTGALGLGLGFGLQKIISNLISGVILLLDKSIKPGDVIEVAGTYGRINYLRTRYVSVITRDGKEFLIPNEDLITNPVINWSFSSNAVRIKADVGISYDADLPEAMRICRECLSDIDRVLQSPEPVCLVKEFGDSSINLQIRFWIKDPTNGVSNVKSSVLVEIWKALKENNISIPYPQRDLHIRSGSLKQ